jgi:hypothetical protein
MLSSLVHSSTPPLATLLKQYVTGRRKSFEEISRQETAGTRPAIPAFGGDLAEKASFPSP